VAQLTIPDFIRRMFGRDWAAPALLIIALFVVLFALAGQILNAPFIYYSPT